MLIPPDAIEDLKNARSIAVLTGAGVSAESGIPTFRDLLTGLWAKYNPEDLASPDAFARDPTMVSRWYDQRRCQLAQCRPNPGHLALAELQRHLQRLGRRFTLITQNVDRLHQSGGSTDVIELHGTLWVWRCLDCGDESEQLGPAFETYPPLCPCSGICRPAVVWFGEELPPAALRRGQSASAACDLFISLGTSSVVYPAAGLIDLALANGARLLEINPQPTPYTPRAYYSLRGPSGEILPQLVNAAFENR